MRYEEVKLGGLEHGDQIAVMGKVANISEWLVPLMGHTGGIYYHHGIYDKESMAVFDFWGESKADAKPQKRDFTEFFAGHSKLYRVVYEEGEPCLPKEEVMERANEAVQHGCSWPVYHLVKNNCESFATYLKTGRNMSKQAIDAAAQIGIKVFSFATASVDCFGSSVSVCR